MTFRSLRAFLAFAAALAVGHPGHAAAADWTTPAERSQFRTTATYAETHAYLERLAAAAPRRLQLGRFGVSPEGRDLMLAVAARDGEFTPAAARASGKEIILVQAGIHAGEIEGNDAALMLLRDLAVGSRYAHLLDHAIVVIVPIFNVDGHAHSGAYNRINQNGPREMGFRATAQYLNLNRDYMKADAPEMRDWLAMFDTWLPDLFIDIHTTDGADYQYDLTWYLEQWGPLDEAIKRWQSDAFEHSILPAVEKKGHLTAPYLDLVDHRDITRGIGNFGSGARYSTGYVALQNRAALLVETHMLKPYATRVAATFDLLVAVLQHIAAHPGELRKLDIAADAATIARAQPRDIPLAFKTSKEPVPFVLAGYAFSHEQSAVSGDTWVHYDPTRKRNYRVAYFRDLVATQSVHAPAAYLVPAAWPGIVEKLREHGIAFERIDRPLALRVERYRLGDPKWADASFEGHHLLSEFSLASETVDANFVAGAILVRLDQRAANVAVNLLEPRAPDSLLAWGFLDAIFEQKEYADERVLERIARDMLAADPTLQAEFDRKLGAEPAFAKSPEKRLAFFYERSPWYATQQVGLYPVVRLDDDALRSAQARP